MFEIRERLYGHPVQLFKKSVNYCRPISPRATPRCISHYFSKQRINIIYRSAAVWLCCAALDAQCSSRSPVSMTLTVLYTGDTPLYRVNYVWHSKANSHPTTATMKMSSFYPHVLTS